MTDGPDTETTAKSDKDRRHARLAEALRANLGRRKAQQRARRDPAAAPREIGDDADRTDNS